MKKRILSLLLAFLMVVSTFPAPAYATDSDVTIIPSETSTETATETACPTCGTMGCTSEHLTWCADCNVDDCGKTHVFCEICQKNDCGQNHCDTCGTIDCTNEHKACDKCGTVDCTADHTNWCADCKVDNCGKNHVYCETCQKNDCGFDHNASEPSEEATEPVAAVNEEGITIDPMVGKLVKIASDASMAWPLTAISGGTTIIAAVAEYAEVMVVTAVETVNGTTYYQLKAADGYSWPENSKVQDGYWLDSTKLEVIEEKEPCEICGEYDCPGHTEPENPCACCDSCTGAEGCECECEGCDFCEKEEEPTVLSISATVNGQTVTVSGDALPEGATLNVQVTNVSAQLNKFGVSESAKVFGLDISVLLADDSQWQPAAGSSVKVKIPVDVTAGTTIGLLHTHEGVTSYIGMTEVLSDGTVEFYTDGFSEFAGFTVDFHYNGTDYSIGGLNSITLSELFVELGIDRNAAHAIEVVFSDNTLIKVTQTDGDWLLESLQAFDTEETLKITFGDGEIIVIDVTDVMYYEGVNGQTYNVPYWNLDSEGVLRIAINYDNVPMTIYLYKESVASLSWNIVTGGSYIDTSGTRTLTVQIKNNIPIESNAVDIDLNPGGRVHLDVYRYIDITYDNGGKAAANMPGNVVDRKITTSTNNYTISSTVPTVQGYTFSHWSGSDGKTYKPGETASLTSNTTLTANWSANPYAYTVVYQSTSGASLGSTTVTYNYGTTNTITPPAIAGYTTPASQSVAWDSTSKTITFTYTPITYTISYTLNGGTVSTANPTSYNIETSTFALNTPTRTGYTFAGWTGTGLSSASTTVSIAKGSTGNKTYTANWTPITYSVSYDGNGSTGGSMSNQSFTYDTAQNLTANAYKREYTVTYNTNGGNTITAATAAATFNGWEDRGSIVYKGTTYAYTSFDAPYYANTYSDLMNAFGYNKYNLLNHWVTYTVNGSETRVAVGSSSGLYPNTANVNNLSTTAGYVVPLYANWTLGSVTLPTPTRAGHTFEGWYFDSGLTTRVGDAGDSYTPTANVTLYAKWTANFCTVTFVDEDGTTILKEATEYEYGTAAGDIEKPIDPTKAATAEYTYTFAGWYPTISDVTENMTYKATYTATKNKHTITWLNDDGTVIDTTSVAYGDVPTHADPTKAATAEYTYTFAGWTPEVVKVTGEATYKATYTAEKVEYTVTWKNEDGTVLETDTVAYGDTPSYDGETPTKAPYNQYTYTLVGWSPAISSVTGDAVYTATFTPHENFYTVTWVNYDGTVLEMDENVAWDTMPEYNGDEPQKNGNAQFSYSFAGWSPAVSKVNGNATYTATFTESINTYTVTWKNENGTVLETDEDVLYGAMPSYDGETPEKAATAQYTYTFDGWDKEVVAVTGDVTYTARFSATVNRYTVTFVDEDGTTILKEAAEYEYGTAAADIGKPTDPTKEATAEHTYTFAGWTPEIAEVTANVTYKATYKEVKNQYTLSGEIDHGTVTDSVTVDYGTEAKITFTPAVGYKFYSRKVNDGAATSITTSDETWSYEEPQLTESKHVVVTTAPIKYTITYYLRDGELGEGITNPGTYTVETETFTLNNPTRVGYKFMGWAASETATTGEETCTIEKGTTGDKTFYAIWERSLVDLTITADCDDQEQSFIFTISGTPTDPSYGTVTLDVVLVGTNSITIKDLPVGTYTVTEKDGWSWRENAVESKTVDLTTTSQTVSFDFGSVDDLHWLSGYSYKRKKGGS